MTRESTDVDTAEQVIDSFRILAADKVPITYIENLYLLQFQGTVDICYMNEYSYSEFVKFGYSLYELHVTNNLHFRNFFV